MWHDEDKTLSWPVTNHQITLLELLYPVWWNSNVNNICITTWARQTHSAVLQLATCSMITGVMNVTITRNCKCFVFDFTRSLRESKTSHRLNWIRAESNLNHRRRWGGWFRVTPSVMLWLATCSMTTRVMNLTISWNRKNSVVDFTSSLRESETSHRLTSPESELSQTRLNLLQRGWDQWHRDICFYQLCWMKLKGLSPN